MLLPTALHLSVQRLRHLLPTRRSMVIALAVCLPWGSVRAQAVRASLGVSLTIVQPVGSTAVRSAPLSRAADGRLSLATSSPVRGPTSHILMVEVTDDATGGTRPLRVALRDGGLERALPRGIATPIGRDGTVGATGSANPFPVSYLVQYPTAAGATEPVRLHVRYLAVAGT